MLRALKKVGIFLASVVVASLAGLLIFWYGWVSFVDNHEYGFAFNRFTGKIIPLERSGYYIYAPIKWSVHCIDLRPYQLSITASFGKELKSSIPSRVLNAKLVKFNPAGLQTFIAWHGRDAADDLANLKEIMKCYAFDVEGGRSCPFITVISEINPSQTGLPAKTAEGKR